MLCTKLIKCCAKKRFSKIEIKTLTFALKEGKSLGYDMITETLLKNLPEKGFIFPKSIPFHFSAPTFPLCI